MKNFPELSSFEFWGYCWVQTSLLSWFSGQISYKYWFVPTQTFSLHFKLHLWFLRKLKKKKRLPVFPVFHVFHSLTDIFPAFEFSIYNTSSLKPRPSSAQTSIHFYLSEVLGFGFFFLTVNSWVLFGFGVSGFCGFGDEQWGTLVEKWGWFDAQSVRIFFLS